MKMRFCSRLSIPQQKAVLFYIFLRRRSSNVETTKTTIFLSEKRVIFKRVISIIVFDKFGTLRGRPKQQLSLS